MSEPKEGLSFANVESYVRDAIGSNARAKSPKEDYVGGLNLTQLREQLTAAAADRKADVSATDSLLDLVKQKREREKLEELRQVKIRHQELRARKRQESTVISKVMMELEKRKQQELELRLQKERIQQGLERVDRTHLGQLEAEKRKELESLTKERQSLQDKEEAILRQVEELEQKIIEQEELNAKRKQEVEDALVRRKGSRLEHKNAELLRLAAAHGQRTSTLLVERNELEKERQRLQDQLEELAGDKGAATLREEGEELDAFVDAVQNRISEQQERVALMRIEHERAQKDWVVSKIADESDTKRLRPEGLDNSLPFTVQAESFLNEWLNEDPNRAPALGQARATLDDAVADNSVHRHHRASDTKGQSSPAALPHPEVHFDSAVNVESGEASLAHKARHTKRHRGRQTKTWNESRSRSALKSTSETSEELTPEARRQLEEEVDVLKEEYANLGMASPSLWHQIQLLEKQLGYRPSKRPPIRIQVPAQPAAPWAGPHTYPSPTSQAGLASPMVTLGPASGFQQQQQQQQQVAGEMVQLEQQQRVFTRTMESLTRKLQALGGADPLPGAMFGATASTGQRGGDGEKNKLLEELSTLDMIPRDSELYDIQVEHLKMITRMRIEMEELQQQQRVSAMKGNLEREQRELEKKAEFEERKLDQERELELAKLRRALARENVDMNWNGHSGPSGKSYDAQAGFACYFDYATGIPKRFHMVRVVYCIYEDETVRSSVKALSACETEADTATRSTAVFATRKKFARIPAVETLRVVMELQCVQDGPQGRAYQSIGWTVLSLFQNGRPGSESLCLNEGPHQLRFHRPPFKVTDIAGAIQPGADPDDGAAGEPMHLFLRMVHMADIDVSMDFVIDPCVTQHLYKRWPPRKETKKGSSSRRKEKSTSRRKGNKSRHSAKHGDDGASELGSVADRSIVSADSAGAQTLTSSASRRKKSTSLKLKKKRRVNLQLDHVAFARESPAHMIFVRVIALGDASCVNAAVRAEAEALKAFPSTSAVIDYSGLPGNARVWESEARDIRVSTGQVSWTRAYTNPTFFDSINIDAQGVLLVKIFERLPEGLDDSSENAEADVADGSEASASMVNKSLDGASVRLVGWAVKPLLGEEGRVESGSAPIALDLLQPPVVVPVDDGRAESLDARIIFSMTKTPSSSSSVVSAASSSASRRNGRRRRRSVASIASIAEEDEDDMMSSEEEDDFDDDEADASGRKRHDGSSVGDSRRKRSPHAKEDPEPAVDDHAPFVENKVKLSRNPPLFERGEDGFDVYIDGARCLPDYATISAVHVKLLAPNYELIGEEHRAHASLGDSAYNPKYRLRAEFRGEAVANPAGTLLFRIDTVDRFTKATKAIGYTCLNPFCMPNGTDEQASKSTTQEYALLRGSFQLPLYQERPDTTQTFSSKLFESSHRVPCATLLVRILPAKKSKDNVHILRLDEFPHDEWERRGLVVPAPRYGPRAGYDTSRCEPLSCEQKLYAVLADREEVLVGEMVTLARRPGVAEDKHVDVMEDKELQDWVVKRLSQPQGMMPLDHAAQYQPETGFAVAIEGLTGLRSRDVGKNKLHKVIFSLNPPGAYYGDPRLTDVVAFTTTHDFDAAVGAPRFLDELHVFRDVPYDPKMVLIVDVRTVRTDRMDQEVFAWAIVPIFSRHGPYTCNGRLHAPLFEGGVQVDVLADLQSSDLDPETFILNEMNKGKLARLKLSKAQASVVVRLVDSLVRDCMQFDSTRECCMPEKLVSKFVTQLAASEGPVKKGSTLGAVIPKTHRQQPEAFERVINEEFAKLTGISNYTF
ncbi:Coiled-coil domain-containing protein 17 [Hondaea fermentalgiana]|uniref:Coiled-coil domain-containing protein 17 n=1 Tax=Hondaea fermentalgiana TaxID=2315210 RepID=A0A2R5GQF9_9STRA|nr:Coiled-coil domain-containing protein 17 [Hondaea fermentalgiana]|eukprot:GBG32008.1 Coiled-coil domain-containing protein 17 [Hondaea fermentalgiana]